MMSMFDCRIRREHGGEDAKFISRHEYDVGSAWCVWGCGCRGDKRVIRLKTGEVLNEGYQYTREELDAWRTFLDTLHPRKPKSERPAKRLSDTPVGPMALT